MTFETNLKLLVIVCGKFAVLLFDKEIIINFFTHLTRRNACELRECYNFNNTVRL